MDYPHPKVDLIDGKIDFTNAYDTGLGAWDKLTLAYSYADIPGQSSKKKFLNDILTEGNRHGLQFISDSDARSPGGAHGNAHLWDNSGNATAELERVLEVRKIAIENFSAENIRTGEAFSVLEDVFVPLYFFHRYQTEAAVKRIGGLNYSYAVKGDEQVISESISAEEQVRALNAIMRTLNADVIAIPKQKLELFPPRAFGFSRSRESFKSNTGVAFDAFGAPATASDMSLKLLLHPERAARLVQQHAINKDLPGLPQVLNELIDNTFKLTFKHVYLQEVQNAINYNVLQHLMNLAAHKDATPAVKAVAFSKISELQR